MYYTLKAHPAYIFLITNLNLFSITISLQKLKKLKTIQI